MAFYAYLSRCRDGSYYAGHTDNLELHMGHHNAGTFGGYTATRRRLELVWSADFPSRYEALSAERRIKGWSRAKKEALIRGDWAEIQRLARNRQAVLRQAQDERD